MRICIERTTGKLIEAQSLAVAGTLIGNAIRMGFKEGDVEEKVVTDEEFKSILRTPDVIAHEAAQAQKAADIVDSLPSWQQIADAIDAAWTTGAQRVIIKRLARVVYWLAKKQGGLNG